MAKQQSSESLDLALKGDSARAGFSLGMASRFDVATVVMICVSVVTGYLVLPPLYSVIQTSLFTTKLTGEIDQFTLRYYEDLFRELQIIGPFLNTFYFSIGSALFATLLGGSIAWIVVRTDSPLRGLGYFTAFASFGTPFILYTIGWLLLLGKAGPVNYWLKILFDQTTPVLNVYSMFGMILIESLLWSPFVFLMLAAAFRSMDPSLEEASAACGARVWQTMRRVSLRLMLPAFFSVMLLIFIRTFESFEIPALVGLPGDIRVLTTSIYLDAQKLPPRYGSAGAFSVLLMVVVAATLYFYFRLTREGDRYQTVTGKGYRPTLINLGRWRYLAGAGLVTSTAQATASRGNWWRNFCRSSWDGSVRLEAGGGVGGPMSEQSSSPGHCQPGAKRDDGTNDSSPRHKYRSSAVGVPMIAIAFGQTIMSFNVVLPARGVGGMVKSFNVPPTTVATGIVAYSMLVAGFVMLGATHAALRRPAGSAPPSFCFARPRC